MIDIEIAKYIIQYRHPDSDIWHDQDVEREISEGGIAGAMSAHKKFVETFPSLIYRIILRIEIPFRLEETQPDHDQS